MNGADTSAMDPADAVLAVRDLVVEYRRRSGWLGGGGGRNIVRAVDGVSFTLGRGETLGLVGESGCGKSTTARTILRLIPACSGSVRLNRGPAGMPDWRELLDLGPRAMRPLRRELQLVFQDPFASLNPRLTIGDALAEPMRLYRLERRGRIGAKVQDLMREVGLDPKFVRRYPHQFSGGQRQRVGIARALALGPATVVLDEPVSALDVSIRAQVLNLLLELQRERGLSYLFIAHDLAVVKRISHRIAVMYLGKIVELATHAALDTRALHPYTQALLSAVPVPDPVVEASRRRIVLAGDPPSPSATRIGCDFASRCPKVMDHCRNVAPQLVPIESGHLVSCHLYSSNIPNPTTSEVGS